MLSGHAICYAHENGQQLFNNIYFNLQNKKYALIGANGIGKSTLARIMAGELQASSGSLQARGNVFYFAQFEPTPAMTVAEYLTDIWEARAGREILIQKLLVDIPFENPLDTLSGGQWMRVRLARALAQPWDFLILDEPTNSLDLQTSELVADALHELQECILVVSHDRQLLRQVDEILELSNQGLQVYGGNFDLYADLRGQEEQRQRDEIQRLKNEKKRRHEEKVEALQKQEKRTRVAEKRAPDMGIPRIMLGGLKRKAQKTAAKILKQEDKLVGDSTEELQEALRREKLHKLIYFEMPDTHFPQGKLLFGVQDFNFRYPGAKEFLWAQNLTLTLRGAVRVALLGKNGSGKSTLLSLFRSGFTQPNGEMMGEGVFSPARCAFIDQNYSLLDLNQSVLENLLSERGGDPTLLRNELSRFLFQGEQVHQKAHTLSGGEKLRLCLAKCLLTPEPAQILILDEPTNNLDLQSIEYLERLLQQYQGALIVVSHDQDFIKNIGCSEQLQLGV